MSDSDKNHVLRELALVLAERKKASPESSYVASLHHKGLNKILEKVARNAPRPSLRQKMPSAADHSMS